MALKIYASANVFPGAPNGQILNLTDDDLLRNSGTALSTLPPSNGNYYSNNGGVSNYTGSASDAMFTNPGHWDGPGAKNFKIEGDAANLGGRALNISNYVHVEVDLQNSSGTTLTTTGTTVNVDGAKRGLIQTGNGNDHIDIGNSSNTDSNPGFSDIFHINTNGGSDTVVIHGASSAGVVNSPYNNYTDGHSTTVVADLGSGNDSFDSTGTGTPTPPPVNTIGGGDEVARIQAADAGFSGFASMDSVNGGSGNDKISTGEGNDTIDGGSGNDTINSGGEGTQMTIGGGGDTVGGYGPELVTNGSFEADTVASGSYANFASLVGWQSSIGGGIEEQNHYPGLIGAYDGNNLVELDSTKNSNAFQDIHTNGTGQFALEFAYSPRDNVPAGSNGIDVYWNGTLLDHLDGGPTSGWALHDYTVTGGGADTRLEFIATGTSDSTGGFIDDVSVKAVIPPAAAVTTTDDDNVTGGSGDDWISTGRGNDTIDGGSGSDTIMAGSGNDLITAGGGSGSDSIDGGDGNDTIYGDSGSEKVTGGAGNDVITGTSGSDYIDGGEDNDNISGGSGSDTLMGGSGNDTLAGGTGNDMLTGGAGSDMFVFSGTSGKETIKDFATGQDKIDVSSLSFANLNYLDSNHDNVVDNHDAHVTYSGGNLDVNLGSGGHAIVIGLNHLDIMDFVHA